MKKECKSLLKSLDYMVNDKVIGKIVQVIAEPAQEEGRPSENPSEGLSRPDNPTFTKDYEKESSPFYDSKNLPYILLDGTDFCIFPYMLKCRNKMPKEEREKVTEYQNKYKNCNTTQHHIIEADTGIAPLWAIFRDVVETVWYSKNLKSKYVAGSTEYMEALKPKLESKYIKNLKLKSRKYSRIRKAIECKKRAVEHYSKEHICSNMLSEKFNELIKSFLRYVIIAQDLGGQDTFDLSKSTFSTPDIYPNGKKPAFHSRLHTFLQDQSALSQIMKLVVWNPGNIIVGPSTNFLDKNPSDDKDNKLFVKSIDSVLKKAEDGKEKVMANGKAFIVKDLKAIQNPKESYIVGEDICSRDGLLKAQKFHRIAKPEIVEKILDSTVHRGGYKTLQEPRKEFPELIDAKNLISRIKFLYNEYKLCDLMMLDYLQQFWDIWTSVLHKGLYIGAYFRPAGAGKFLSDPKFHITISHDKVKDAEHVKNRCEDAIDKFKYKIAAKTVVDQAVQKTVAGLVSPRLKGG